MYLFRWYSFFRYFYFFRMTKPSYIIIGAGASGLLLAYRMSQDRYFDDQSILIFDQVRGKGNDRTWSYWEEGAGEWDELLTKKWSKVFFGSTFYSETLDISPYYYKVIRSKLFYEKLWASIRLKPHIKFIEEQVRGVSETRDGVQVDTNESSYLGAKVFNSILDKNIYRHQNKYPVLQQHFMGWFVKRKDGFFDDSVATFMDFNLDQKGNTRFMYVLPLDQKTALFEYTLFSKDFLHKEEYEQEIRAYLKKKKITDYELLEKEVGSIPMTSFRFEESNSKNILHIGTAGGWTKASTGYTFLNTSKKTTELTKFLKTENDLSLFAKKTKFWFYDLLFLDVLAEHNEKGSMLFASLFKRVKVSTILRFLAEDSSIREDLKIIVSVPSKLFSLAIIKRLLRGKR